MGIEKPQIVNWGNYIETTKQSLKRVEAIFASLGLFLFIVVGG